MSMVVKNNVTAVRTLNTLNQNSSALQKSLAKVSSGMKINSAQDDASAYAISERMRIQIRSLDQAKQNTQNASSLVKTAEGAVASTLEIVKTMKEKAINAANDTNTDADRAIIQKELDQFIDQIDDNALVSFNGKILLDGSSMPIHNQNYTKQQNIVRGLNSAWLSDALTLIKDTYGVDFESGPAGKSSAKYLKVEFVGSETGVYTSNTAVAWASSGYKSETVTITFNLDVIKELETLGQDGQDGRFKIGQDTTGDGQTDTLVYNGQSLDRVIAHELTHGVMMNRFKFFENLPSWIKEGGSAELVHGADERIFASDTYLTSAQSFQDNVFSASGTGVAALSSYSGGYVAMRYFANVANIDPSDAMMKFMESMDKGKSVDESFRYASDGKFKSLINFQTVFLGELDSYGTNGVLSEEQATNFLKEKCGIDLTNTDTGAVTGSDAGGKITKTDASVVHEVGSPVNWRMPSSTTSMIGGLQVIWPDDMSVANGGGGNMVFHIGAKANDQMHVGFYDMRARAIGLYDEEGSKLNIATQSRARAAISTLDKIVNLVVDQQTSIGSMLQRLDYTAQNLVTSTENTTASESNIRDADMAKEMTNYTRNNIMLQAAQSMLAQANQNSSAVLSLLQ